MIIPLSRDSAGSNGVLQSQATFRYSLCVRVHGGLSCSSRFTNGVEKRKEHMDGIHLIKAERERQMAATGSHGEGWTPEHDDGHDRGELAITAACYAVQGTTAEVHQSQPSVRGPDYCIDAWPFGVCDDKRKKHSRIRQLTIAGALIAAEIDRKIRAGETA